MSINHTLIKDKTGMQAIAALSLLFLSHPLLELLCQLRLLRQLPKDLLPF